MVLAALLGMKCSLLWFSFAFPLLAKDVEHLFVGLLVICLSSLQKCLSRSLAHIDWITYLRTLWIQATISYIIRKCFPHSTIVFHLLDGIF